MTDNLVFTVTPSVYHLAVNPINNEIFRITLKYPRGHRVLHHFENLYFKFHDRSFHQNCYFRAALKRTIYRKMWLFQFSRYLMKVSVSVLNQLKTTLCDLLFLTAIYFPENDNKHSSEMTRTNVVFWGLGSIHCVESVQMRSFFWSVFSCI